MLILLKRMSGCGSCYCASFELHRERWRPRGPSTTRSDQGVVHGGVFSLIQSSFHTLIRSWSLGRPSLHRLSDGEVSDLRILLILGLRIYTCTLLDLVWQCFRQIRH